MPPEPAPPSPPTLMQAARFWLKLGCISFGGPAAQIALMREELVERRRWISNPRFLHALNYCMLLPGPEAQQLATYLGWLMHRHLGGLIAGLLFILPGAILMVLLAAVYVTWGHTGGVAALLAGVQPAVVAVVVASLLRLAQQVLRRLAWLMIALMAFAALAFAAWPFPLVILAAACAGAWLGPGEKPVVASTTGAGASSLSSYLHDDDSPPPPHAHTNLLKSLGVSLCGLLFGLAIYALLVSDFQRTLAGFFTTAALVSFGGAYAVLPYVAQASVETHGWITPAQLAHALSLGESTPGPLILVLTFIGFLAGVTEAGQANSYGPGILAALIVTFFTFLPSFLFIFVGAPWIERHRSLAWGQGLLAGIRAAVVGVMAALALYLARHTLWAGFPHAQPDWTGIAMMLAALLALLRYRQSAPRVILACALLGLVRPLFTT